MAKSKSKTRKKKQKKDVVVPHFTGSLDARVPAENIILAEYITSLDRWVVLSASSDARVFVGNGKTEPLARRIAGLRTLEHLDARAEGRLADISETQIAEAKRELKRELKQLAR